MDIIDIPTSPRNYEYILLPLKSKDMDTVTKSLITIFNIFGYPNELHSDNGSEFVNHLMSMVCKKAGVQQIMGPPYHPQTQGLIERRHQMEF